MALIWEPCLYSSEHVNIQGRSTSIRQDAHGQTDTHTYIGREEQNKKCPKGPPRRSTSESAGPKRGAEESAEKVLGVPSPILLLHRRGARSTFFGTFLGTSFRTGTFRSTLFGTFPGRGLGTSLDGRQDRNSCGHLQASKFTSTKPLINEA